MTLPLMIKTTRMGRIWKMKKIWKRKIMRKVKKTTNRKRVARKRSNNQSKRSTLSSSYLRQRIP